MDRLEELCANFEIEPFAIAGGMLAGAKLDKLETGKAEISVEITLGMMILEKIAHGGAAYAIGNSAGVFAAMSVIPAGHTRAVDGNISYTRAAKLGERVRGVAEVTDETGSFIIVSYKIVGGDGKSRAAGMIRYAKPKQTRVTPAS